MRLNHPCGPSAIRTITFLLLLVLTPFLNAARILDGSLGLWIADEASPLLAEILMKHPRFKGEKIKIMAMQDGQPVRITNSLTDEVRRQLTDDLLTLADIKILFNDDSRCQSINVHTILGIEVKKHDNRSHRVSLALVDTNEGIWLNGTNISWVGRMTNSQRREFQSPAVQTRRTAVFSSTEVTEMATALHDQLKCNGFIATPIYFTQPEDDTGRGVIRKLRERIANRAQVTLNKSSAASIITLVSPDLTESVGILYLELSDIDADGQALRIAEINVSNGPALQPLTTSQDYSPDLMSAIQINEGRSSRNVCETYKKGCVPVSFNLNRSAYTLLFYTIQGKVSLVNCESPTRQRRGRYDYGLNVPALNSAPVPGLGFYALAVTDRKTARSFHQLLSRNASGCGRKRSLNHHQDASWLSSFNNLLSQYKTKTDWKAIHLVREDHRLIQM